MNPELENPQVEETKINADPAVAPDNEPAPNAEAPAVNEPVAKAEEPGAEGDDGLNRKHRVSNNAMRWIFFALVLVFIGLAILVQSLHVSYTAFGNMVDSTNVQSYVNILTGGPGVEVGMRTVLTLLIGVAWVIGSIISLIRLIMLLVNFFGFLTGAKNRKKLIRRFRSAMKNLAHQVGYFFVFDMLLCATGTLLPVSAIVEIIILFALILAGWANRELYREVTDKGIDWRRLLPELAFLGGYVLILVLVVVRFANRDVMSHLPAKFGEMDGASGSQVSTLMPPLIEQIFGAAFAIVAMVVGLTMVTSFAAYYPYNDQKKEKVELPHCQSALLPKSIVMTVFAILSGVAFYLGGFLADIQATIMYCLIPVLVLLMVIAMRVAYNLDHPAEKEEKAEEEE